MPQTKADIERLERYHDKTSEHLLGIINDEDQAAQIELECGTLAWTSTLRYD